MRIGKTATTRTPNAFGALLRYWRRARNVSQLRLAIEAGVSPRHVCFIETGRAKPSREMVVQLTNALDVPLREQNSFLLAAGYAPLFRETNLESDELKALRDALDAILHQQEPYPAVVMNRTWDILKTNRAASCFFGYLLGAANANAPANVIRMMFDPDGLKPYVRNWERTAEMLIRRVHREAVGGVADEAIRKLLQEVLALPGVPERLRTPQLETPQIPVLPVTFAKDDRVFEFFSTVTTLGTPQDITLQEIRIECFFPLTPQTQRLAKELLSLS